MAKAPEIVGKMTSASSSPAFKIQIKVPQVVIVLVVVVVKL